MPLSRLNQEQFVAATTQAGSNLIVASAGTGKTSTIVARISYLLNEGVKPERILLLTFTNKAAAQMLQRVERYFDKNTVDKIESGTFHAVSYKLLRKIGRNIKLKTPKDLKILLKTIHAKRRFDHIDSPVKPYLASYLYDMFSLYQNSSLNPSFSKWLEESGSEHGVYFDIYEDIFEEFKDLKKEYGYVDFNDLLILMRDALKNNREIRFSEVLVDEYQDTNILQNSLIDAVKKKSLFCVGDYDQSIYAFNGANIENIATYSTRYPDATVYTLKTNYRSTAPILSLANRVIEKNERIYPKKLEVGRHGKTHPPRLLMYNDLFEQYQSI
ncbi:MAG: ATP-dependent helicase, partial [Campylobacteraceae bacterium]|nr:ATP-dependent helicase [Campylobacteraceae bacterium]